MSTENNLTNTVIGIAMGIEDTMKFDFFKEITNHTVKFIIENYQDIVNKIKESNGNPSLKITEQDLLELLTDKHQWCGIPISSSSLITDKYLLMNCAMSRAVDIIVHGIHDGNCNFDPNSFYIDGSCITCDMEETDIKEFDTNWVHIYSKSKGQDRDISPMLSFMLNIEIYESIFTQNDPSCATFIFTKRPPEDDNRYTLQVVPKIIIQSSII